MSAAGNTRERGFFLLLAGLCVLTVFAGFAPSYYLKNVIHAPPPLSAMTHIHGVVFTAWVLVFLTQATLISRGNAALHRRIGMLGVMLFGVVATVGVATALNAGRAGHAPPGAPPPLVFMALPLMGIAATVCLFVAAIWNRSRSEAHMRYMLAALFSMTPPATDRLALAAGYPGVSIVFALVMMDVLLGVAMLYDYITLKRIHPAYLWSAAVFLVTEAGVAWAFHSPAWLPFAQFVTQS
ncbi:MAG TPA: hypothetical protein VMJ73_16320 [Rhizomicrobium sp.]|nr:hypothetical protein [Rhizomicrobium sp.]